VQLRYLRTDVMYVAEAVDDLVTSLRDLCCSSRNRVHPSASSCVSTAKEAPSEVRPSAGGCNQGLGRVEMCEEGAGGGEGEGGAFGRESDGGAAEKGGVGNSGGEAEIPRGAVACKEGAARVKKRPASKAASIDADEGRKQGKKGTGSGSCAWASSCPAQRQATEVLIAHGRNRTAATAFFEKASAQTCLVPSQC